MSDHFTLDVDPESLRRVARELRRMGGHLKERGGDARETPGQIGDDWTGDAATDIKAEMTALGFQMSGFWTHFEASADGLVSLAGDYDDAVKQVAGLNTRWDDAQETYAQATQAADTQYDRTVSDFRDGGGTMNRTMQMEFSDSKSHAYTAASDARQTTQHNLEYSFGMMKQWLAQQTRSAGQKLVDGARLEVTAEQIAAWKGGGTYPVRLDRTDLLSVLELAGQREEQEREAEAEEAVAEDLEALNALLEQQPIQDPAALNELLEKIGENQDDTYYAEELVRELGPDGLASIYDSIDDYRNFSRHDTDEMIEAEEWLEGLQALNDTVATGLAQYNNADLAAFVGEYGGPTGGPTRLAMLLGSDNADGRLNGFGLVYLERIGESKYQPGELKWDIAQDLLSDVLPSDPGDMARQFADRTSATELTDLVNDVEPEVADWIMEGLLSDGTYNEVLSQEQFAAKREVYRAMLQEAVDESLPRVMEPALKYLTAGGEYTGYTDQMHDDLEDLFTDPDAIMMLAANKTALDGETVARAADIGLDGADVEELLQQITTISVANGDGAKKTADDLGYLLGLSDAAEISVDYGDVVGSIVGELAGMTGKAAVVTGPVVSILQSIFEANEEANQQYEDYGEGWTRERQHEVLAFVLHLQENGAPEGYEQWLEDNEDDFPSDSPDAAITGYLKHLRDADGDSAEYQTWSDIEELYEQIGETRRIGDVDL